MATLGTPGAQEEVVIPQTKVVYFPNGKHILIIDQSPQ